MGLLVDGFDVVHVVLVEEAELEVLLVLELLQRVAHLLLGRGGKQALAVQLVRGPLRHDSIRHDLKFEKC